VTRHGLLMTAVATVTVPGILAMLAVVGHDHVAAEAGVTATALDGAPLSGPFPVAPATAQAGVRNNVAGVQRASGAPVTVLSRVTVSQQLMGTRLLDSAAGAGLSASYQGTELISQSGVGGSVEMTSQVWHQGEGSTVVETTSGTTPATAGPAASFGVTSSDPVSGSPEGVFGVTKSLVALLGKHYVAVYQGGGAAGGRTASVVELYRFDGSLAAQYWLDKQTMVPLRRELFGPSGEVISEDSFVQVKFGALPVAKFAAADAAKARSQADEQPASPSAWVTAVPAARFVTSLSGQGWQVPGSLPGGLPLYGAAWTKTTTGEVVDLQYSDGLYVVSLFVQRGTLAPGMSGWRQASVDGQQAFVSGDSVTWAGPGFVYTMIADAPAQTVTQVVGALPSSGSSPGVLDRLGRGLVRIARVISPFG
jgi:sigma-E factor negative regulatory protein RseB